MRYFKLAIFVLALATLFLHAVTSAQQSLPQEIKGGILNAKALNLPKPQYPEEAKLAKVGGPVSVQVTIDEGGNVILANVVTAPNGQARETMTADQQEKLRLHDLLAGAAEDAARQARFTQTLLSGTPVKVTGTIVYNFVPGDDQKTRAINGGVLNGKAINLPHPEYPAAARAVNASGAVTIQVLVDENGDVISASAVSGHPLLRAAAENAAREAKFSPTLLSGQPVKISGVITYVFIAPKKDEKKVGEKTPI